MPTHKTFSVKTLPDSGFDLDIGLVSRLLALRGIDHADIDATETFMQPDYVAHTHDPFLFKDMQKSIERIVEAIQKEERILVYSDFDADGLPGAAIIHDFFTTISYPRVEYFAPDRHTQGFGVHADVVHAYADKGVTLVITIDCGIADVASIKEIKAAHPNLDIIVTDHHLPASELPPAYSIINPKQEDCQYPEKMLCGAAVMFKIVCAMVAHIKSKELPQAAYFKEGYEKWLLDLVAIATLSDMVPLTGENRVLAMYGLMVFKKTRRPGLNALCYSNMLDKRTMTEDDIAFTIAPRINVASRLREPALAFRLLTTRDANEAEALAKELNSVNTKRKTMVAATVKHALQLVKEYSLDRKPLLVLGHAEWKPPILGLVATQLLKSYKRPVFVWGTSDDGVLKGSIRSVEGVDIVALMNKAPADLFIKKGGHAMSGGFAIEEAQVQNMEKELIAAFVDGKDVKGIEVTDSEAVHHVVDAEIEVTEVNQDTYNEISALAPFGMANLKPLFAITGIVPCGTRLFGKQKEHLEIDCGPVKAIQFFNEFKEGELEEFARKEKPVIIGHIEKNQFRGASEIRIKIVDIV